MLELHLKVVVTVSSVPGVLILTPERRDEVLEKGNQDEDYQVPYHAAHHCFYPHLVEGLHYCHCPGSAEEENQEYGHLLQDRVQDLPDNADQVAVEHAGFSTPEHCHGNGEVGDGGNAINTTNGDVEQGYPVLLIC